MLFSYIEVNNKFYSTLESGKQCSSNNDYKNNHYLLTQREKIIELCNFTQEKFEDEIDLLFKNMTKKETYINDLFDIPSEHKYELLGCFDYNRINYIKNELDDKIIRLLNDETIMFKYFYYFLKCINSFLNFIFLMCGVILMLFAYGANYFLLELVQLISEPIGNLV